jgi:hypothetical protein
LLKRDPSAEFNGGFEVAEDGIPVNWAFFPNPEADTTFQVAVDPTRAVEGTQSLNVTTSPGRILPGFRSRQVQVRVGASYRISVSLINSGSSITVNRIVQDSSGKTAMRRDAIIQTSDNIQDWRTFGETLNVAEGEAQVLLIFLIEGSGTAWFDDVRVEEIQEGS